MTTHAIRVLFQGDSITDAFRKPEEINPAYQLGNGYAFLAAARLAARFPGRFEFVNRGVSGQTVQHLASRWDEDALLHRPDVLSLLVGLNSVIRRSKGQDELREDEIFATYRSLLVRLREQNPGIRFLLLEPFLLETGIGTRELLSWLTPIQREIAGIAEEYGATFIPLQRLFDEALDLAPAAYWAYDGVHPTHAGFQLIADAWLEAFERVLPTLEDGSAELSPADLCGSAA